MVPESAKSTGVTMPYEKAAINGEEMPDGLEYPDQILFLNLRMLYEQFRKGVIDRETAQNEKKKLLLEYEQYQFRCSLEKHWVDIIRNTELARAAFRKKPSIETAERLCLVLEGRGKQHQCKRRDI